MQNSGDAAGVAAAGLGMGVILLYIAVIVAMFVAYYKIVEKSGYPGWYVFVMLVPCVNIIMLFMFAFKPWPIQEELERLRRGGGGMPPGPPGAANYYRPPDA